MERTLSQEEIDAVFTASRSRDENDQNIEPPSYNFGRSDRIPKPQLKAIQGLHENFARDLTIAFSAYLRDYVVINVISVEQITFAEFLESLTSPTALVGLRVQPFSEASVLEVGPAVYSPVVEVLMGGHASRAAKIKRKLTEIEQSILDGLIRLVLNNLKVAWRPVHELEFVIEAQETDPQVFRVLAPNDGVVAVAIEVRIGENVGMMNIAMNSLTIARLRERFDHNKSYKKLAGEEEQGARLRLFSRALLDVEALLRGSPLPMRDFLKVSVGDVLMLDVPVSYPVDLLLNRVVKFRGQVVASSSRRALAVEGRADQNLNCAGSLRHAELQQGPALPG